MKAYVINNLNIIQNVNYANKLINDKEFVILTSSVIIKKFFDDKGCRSFIIDKFLTKDDALKLSQFFIKLSNSWFRDKNGHDIFEYDGLPLAECCMLEFIGSEFAHVIRFYFNIKKAIKLLNITEICCDKCEFKNFEKIFKKLGVKYSFLLADAKDIQTISVISALPKFIKTCSNLYNYNWKHLLTIIYNHFSSFLRLKSSHKKILFGSYYNTFSFINKIKANNLILLLGFKYNFKLLIQNNVIFFCYNNNKADINTTSKPLKFINAENFYHDNVNILDLFEDEFKDFSLNSIPKIKVLSQKIKNFIEKYSPQIFVTPFDSAPQERLAVYICKNLSIPSIKLQHGIYTDYNNTSADAIFNRCDYLMPFSPADGEITFSHISKNKKIYISSPMYDHYRNIMHKHIIKNEYIILINPLHAPEYYYPVSISEEEIFFFDVLNAIKKYKNKFKVLIRVHPGLSSKHFHFIVDNWFKDLSIKFSEEKYFYDSLKKSDLFISSFSTAVFEAAAANIPCLFYNPGQHDWLSPFNNNNKDLPQAQTEKQLSSLLDKFLNAYNSQEWFVNENIIRKYGIIKDGKNSERVYKVIESLINKG